MPIEYQDNGDGTYTVIYDNGMTQIVDANGNVLSSGYTGAMPATDLSAIPSGQAVVVDKNGSPVRDQNGQYLLTTVPEGVDPTYYNSAGHPAYDGGLVPSYYPQAPASDTPITDSAMSGGGYGYSRNYSYGRSGYGYGYGGGSGYGGGGFNPYSSSSSETGGYGSTPRYANGQTHPFFGGAPLVPGGQFAAQDDGYDNRQQVRVPGGATAGPFEVSAAPMPSGGMTGNYGSRGGGGGGGGGSGYGANSALGQKLESKVRGMAAKITGGGGSSGGYTSDRAYARQQHRANKEYRQQQRAYADGSYIYDQYKMRGAAKKLDPQQAEAYYVRPSMFLQQAVPEFKGNAVANRRYHSIASLPAGELGMMAYGKKGKAKDGPSQYVNNLAKFYQNLAYTGDMPDYATMAHNLTTAKKRSPLGQVFKQPLGYAGDAYERYVGALISANPTNDSIAQARMMKAQALIDEYGSGRAARRKAGKGQPINKYVGERMGWA